MDVDDFIAVALDAFAARSQGPVAQWIDDTGLHIVRADATAVRPIATALITASVDSLTFLDDILSFLPMEDWPALVALAIPALRQDASNASALSMLEKGSYQSLATLHPYLRDLLPLQERAGLSFGVRAFRETLLQDIDFLLYESDEDAVSDALIYEAAHRLIALNPVPAGVGVTGLSRLDLIACLSCLCDGAGHAYQYDTDGHPHDVETYDTPVTPEFHAEPLPEALVSLADLGSRWRWQDWGASNGRENLNRLGGHPSWVQYADYPKCPLCAHTMSFLLQLDSDFINADGLGYVFWCDDCKVSCLRDQQT